MAIAAPFRPFVEALAASTGIRIPGTSIADLSRAANSVLKRRGTPVLAAPAATRKPDAARKRYIVAPLLHQQSAGPVVRDSLRTLHDTLLGQKDIVVRSENETGRKVLKLSDLEFAVLKQRFPTLLIEPDVQYHLPRTPLLPEIEPIAVTAAGSRPLTVRVTTGGNPVAGVAVVLVADAAKKRGYSGTTDAEGALRLSVRKSDARFARVVAEPRDAYWSRVWKNVPYQAQLGLPLTALRIQGFDWGHRVTGIDKLPVGRGQGVRVAVIDSGIARHPSLHIGAGKNFIDGESASDWDKDEVGHGTHCAGIIAALQQEATTWGYAPQITLNALRVFGGADGGGYASDIGDAIAWAVEADVDIINMSLESPTAASYIRMNLEKATDHGVLCVAAAGNQGGPVSYPAKFRNVVGVSAIGKFGAYPAESLHKEAESNLKSADGVYYLASFSNRGEEVDLCAPGVAITSTVPANGFSSWDGTSMACPHVAGVAAVALESSPVIASGKREVERMGLLLDRVMGLCQDLGLAREHQGAGLPLMNRL